MKIIRNGKIVRLAAGGDDGGWSEGLRAGDVAAGRRPALRRHRIKGNQTTFLKCEMRGWIVRVMVGTGRPHPGGYGTNWWVAQPHGKGAGHKVPAAQSKSVAARQTPPATGGSATGRHSITRKSNQLGLPPCINFS